MTRSNSLHDDLPPRIGVDPGSRRTAISCSVGTDYLGGVVLINDEPATALGPHAIPVSYSYGYADRIQEAVALATIRPLFRDAAVAWWGVRGVHIPDNASPFLVGIEKVNLPNTRGGRVVGVVEALSVVAATAVGTALWSHTPRTHRVEVIPWQADTSWEQRHGGTGRLADYYPYPVIESVLRPDQHPDGIYPDGWLDRAQFRASGIKDVVAAWAIGQAAATNWVRASQRLSRGRILAPHEAPFVALDLARHADADLRTRYQREGLA